MTQVYAIGSTIVEADIVLNSAMAYPSYGSIYPLYGWWDGQGACTHELGHFLGLDHSQYSDATMWYIIGPNEIWMRDLSADDILGIITLYP